MIRSAKTTLLARLLPLLGGAALAACGGRTDSSDFQSNSAGGSDAGSSDAGGSSSTGGSGGHSQGLGGEGGAAGASTTGLGGSPLVGAGGTGASGKHAGGAAGESGGTGGESAQGVGGNAVVGVGGQSTQGAGGAGGDGSGGTGAGGSNPDLPPPICNSGGNFCGQKSCYFVAVADAVPCLSGQDPALKTTLNCPNSGSLSPTPTVTMMGSFLECCYTNQCVGGRPLLVDRAPRVASLRGRRDWAA